MSLARLTTLIVATLSLSLHPAVVTQAAEGIIWDGSEPAPGIYFYWYEPSFYAGFAPRTQDPSRVHIELSRGNQVRLTVVLGDEQIDAYLDDLLLRRELHQELVDKTITTLSTNSSFERYLAKLDSLGVAEIVAKRQSLGPAAYRARTLDVMSRLNPGRMFTIKLAVDGLIETWHAALAALSPEDMKALEKRLDAANAILPGRVNLYELGPELEASLTRAVELAHAGSARSPEFRDQALSFLAQATHQHYPVRDGTVTATEFTAIYPAGTVAQWTKTRHGRLPAFGVTGVWPLISRIHGKGVTGMVDYLSTNPGYGFISLLGYQHAGGNYYNAFHNAGIRSPVGTPYFPREWRSVPGERTPKKPYQNLWIISRGPASHGCTRLDSGHMSELRHVLPSDSDVLEKVATHRNLPECFDVFDIDGNGRPEVMGVEYFLAYESEKHRPVKAHAPNDRTSFYQWLYGSSIGYNPDGSAFIREAPVCRFVGTRKAVEASVQRNVPLHEAAFTPAPIQFYRIGKIAFDSAQGLSFNRELRRVGTGHDLDRGRLLLE